MKTTVALEIHSTLNGELSQKLGVINEWEELSLLRQDLFKEINHNPDTENNEDNLVLYDAFNPETVTENDYIKYIEEFLGFYKPDFLLQINFGYSVNHTGFESHIACYGDIPKEVYKLQEYINLMGLRCPILPMNSNTLEAIKNDRINDSVHVVELTICAMDNPLELKHYNRDELVKAIVLAFTPDKNFRYKNFFYQTEDNYAIYIGEDGEPIKNTVAHNKYWNENGYICTGLFRTANGDYMFGDDETGELARDGWFEAGMYSGNYLYADKDGIVITKDEAQTMTYQKGMDGVAYNFGPYLISVRYGNVYDQHPKMFRATNGKLYPFVHNIK